MAACKIEEICDRGGNGQEERRVDIGVIQEHILKSYFCLLAMKEQR